MEQGTGPIAAPHRFGWRACLAEECQGPVLDALIATGFVRMQYGDRLALTDAGWARARALRLRRPF
jgi:hypothetical protein